MSKNKILFYGELPTSIVHGISISNKINLTILEEKFGIVELEEKRNIINYDDKIFKIIKLFAEYLKFISINIFTNYNFFYTPFAPKTKLGIIKILLFVKTSKLLNKNMQVILHVHRGTFLEDNNFFNKISKIIFNNTSKLILLSPQQKATFSELISDKKQIVLANTIEKETQIYKKNIDNKKFIYVSNYLETKGIFDLLDVFQELSNIYDIKLYCYGSFPNEQIRKQVHSYQSDKIIINSFLNTEEKYNLFQSSDCLILPSWTEGLPLVLIEAISMGLPIITSNVGYVKDIVGDDYKYIYESKNKIKLKDTVESFILSDNNNLPKKLTKRYNKYFSNSVHKNKLLQIFTNG